MDGVPASRVKEKMADLESGKVEIAAQELGGDARLDPSQHNEPIPRRCAARGTVRRTCAGAGFEPYSQPDGGAARRGEGRESLPIDLHDQRIAR
jgi:hypothetical protein